MKTPLQPEFISGLKESFAEQVTLESISSSAVYIKTDASLVKKISEHIVNRIKGRFITCAALDYRKERGNFTVAYLFSLDKAKTFLCIKIDLDSPDVHPDSITPVIPGANWAEREMKDMSGIIPQGHPDLRRLILADDWPEKEYPLRRDFSFDYKPASVSGVAPGLKSPPASTTLLPLGSFYGQKEITTYLNLFVYAEKVVDADYRGFYNHRGLEKMGESVLNYNQIPFVAERICACCGFSHSTCYCQAIESAAQLEVPPRAKFIRTLLLEIERLYSHSLWLASTCNMEGLTSLFVKCVALQQSIIDLSQLLTGNRIIFGMNIIGGVRRDIEKKKQSHVYKLIDHAERGLKVILESLQSKLSFFSRMRGISTLPKSDMQRYCAVGQTARASGISTDVRIDHPYAAYDKLHINPIYRGEGDNLARVSVRLDEMTQSISLLRETLEKMPEGAITTRGVEIPPHTDCISAVESPKGETVHYVLTGESNRPLRWKIMTATFLNLQIIPLLLRGTNIADARISINSIDPCFSCTEH